MNMFNSSSIRLLTEDNNISGAASNLALDEAILNCVEHGLSPSTIRIWENSKLSLVLGTGNSISKNIFLDNCNQKIEITRRCSGGGTVLIGKGILNYSFIFKYDLLNELKHVNKSYSLCAGIIQDFLNKKFKINTEFYFPSDIAISGKKISGNSQARKKNAFLHHGTILVDFDLSKMGKYLRFPLNTPSYRNNRPHIDFATTLNQEGLNIKCEELKKNMVSFLNNSVYNEILSSVEREKWKELLESKYLKEEWIYKIQ